jgi:hypothetical protein
MISRIDVKNTGGPFNLGPADKWSKSDIAFLVDQGGIINEVGYLHMPLDLIQGKVSLGIGQKGPPPELWVGGRRLHTGKQPFIE